MWDQPPGHPLRRMFAGITEHAFMATIGVADPPLIDYLSELLSRFVHSDSVFGLRGENGRRLSELTTMVIEAEKLPPEGRTRREYHRHIGDYALFWSGLFPESVNRLQARPCKDHVVNFTALGKRAYHIASTFEEDKYRDEAAIFRRLSEQFEMCAYGLREVRREWEELAHNTPPGTGLIG
ncbi:hypothetical protein [Fimbriiglobus ruber]|uniref:Uncharacterized protein n=1 Tax=Fimbriiglobus ruber TaxID=1908690 RepID=A0A225DZD6_9BACT|nr:hypothetical protein [Fimbriiglobus ruber]OWK46721.1 hypothetical protein FRUB_00420 [Fimbriiglobus ruber]